MTTYNCNHCGTPMERKHDALYRRCDCKRAGYVAVDGPEENLILMPFKGASLDKRV